MKVWLVFREPGGIDSVWATLDDAERYAERYATRRDEQWFEMLIEPYEVRHNDGGGVTPPPSGGTPQ